MNDIIEIILIAIILVVGVVSIYIILSLFTILEEIVAYAKRCSKYFKRHT